MNSRFRTRWTTLGRVVLCGCFTAAVVAQTPERPVELLHAPSSSLQRLPPSERAIVLKLLRPELGPLFQGEAITVADDVMRSFRAERLNLGGISAVAVQSTGGELCGATGNCSFWIVDLLHRRVLLRAESVEAFATDKVRPHIMPELVTATHESAASQERIRWIFVSGHYEPQSCATVDSADASGTTLSQPKITPHPCSPEGN